MIPFDAPLMPDTPPGDIPGSSTLDQISGILEADTERAQILYPVISSLSQLQLVTLILV